MRRPRFIEGSPCDVGRLSEENVGYFQLILTEKPKSLLPFIFRLLIPHGPKVFPYILDIIPKLAFTSCPPVKLAFFGTEHIMLLRISMNYVCSSSSTGG